MMPSLYKLTDEKKSEEFSDVTILEPTPTSRAAMAESRKNTKLIIVGVIVTVAMVLAAILFGMYMFIKAEKELIEYTLPLGDKFQQKVTVNPNTNSAHYYVDTPGQETWIIKDFNTDIEVTKIKTDSTTTCYILPLDKTVVSDLSVLHEPLPSNKEPTAKSFHYETSKSPIIDISFLGQPGVELCTGVPTYWLKPMPERRAVPLQSTNVFPSRKKRVINPAVPDPVSYVVTAPGPLGVVSPNGLAVCLAVDLDVLNEALDIDLPSTLNLACCIACCKVQCGCNIQVLLVLDVDVLECRFLSQQCPDALFNYTDPSCFPTTPVVPLTCIVPCTIQTLVPPIIALLNYLVGAPSSLASTVTNLTNQLGGLTAINQILSTLLSAVSKILEGDGLLGGL